MSENTKKISDKLKELYELMDKNELLFYFGIAGPVCDRPYGGETYSGDLIETMNNVATDTYTFLQDSKEAELENVIVPHDNLFRNINFRNFDKIRWALIHDRWVLNEEHGSDDNEPLIKRYTQSIRLIEAMESLMYQHMQK